MTYFLICTIQGYKGPYSSYVAHEYMSHHHITSITSCPAGVKTKYLLIFVIHCTTMCSCVCVCVYYVKIIESWDPKNDASLYYSVCLLAKHVSKYSSITHTHALTRPGLDVWHGGKHRYSTFGQTPHPIHPCPPRWLGWLGSNTNGSKCNRRTLSKSHTYKHTHTGGKDLQEDTQQLCCRNVVISEWGKRPWLKDLCIIMTHSPVHQY